MKAKNRVKTYYSQAMAAEAFDLMYDWRRQSKDFSRVDRRDRFGWRYDSLDKREAHRYKALCEKLHHYCPFEENPLYESDRSLTPEGRYLIQSDKYYRIVGVVTGEIEAMKLIPAHRVYWCEGRLYQIDDNKPIAMYILTTDDQPEEAWKCGMYNRSMMSVMGQIQEKDCPAESKLTEIPVYSVDEGKTEKIWLKRIKEISACFVGRSKSKKGELS